MKTVFATATVTALLAFGSFSLANGVQEKVPEKQVTPSSVESSSFKLWRPHILERLRARRGGNTGQAGGTGNQPIRGPLRRLLHRQPQPPQQ